MVWYYPAQRRLGYGTIPQPANINSFLSAYLTSHSHDARTQTHHELHNGFLFRIQNHSLIMIVVTEILGCCGCCTTFGGNSSNTYKYVRRYYITVTVCQHILGVWYGVWCGMFARDTIHCDSFHSQSLVCLSPPDI